MPTLEWIGKDKVVNHHQEVPFRILDKKYTFNAENSENMIIHGDNLLALKSLLPQYEGLIDCIYIDPPYNTGNEKMIPVFGVDATDAAKNLISGGKMTGTVKQDGDGMAEAIVKVSEAALSGQSMIGAVDKEMTVGEWRINIPYSAYTGDKG